MDPLLEPAPFSGKEKKLLEQMRDVMRVKHYSLRTERSYCDWVERFIRFDSFAPAHSASQARPSMSWLPSYSFTACGIRARWPRRRLALFSPIWHVAKTSHPREPKTRCDSAHPSKAGGAPALQFVRHRLLDHESG